MNAIDFVNLLLVMLTLGCVLRLVRQQALLARLRTGLQALRERRYEVRLSDAPAQSDPTLDEFDLLARDLSARQDFVLGSAAASHLGSVLDRLFVALRPPLQVIHQQIQQLKETQASAPDNGAIIWRDTVNQVETRVASLLRVMESAGNISDFRRGLSGLKNDLGSTAEFAQPHLLFLDAEGPPATAWKMTLEAAGWRVTLAASCDSVPLLGQLLSPRATIVNALTPGGLGWRLLERLSLAGRAMPCMFFGLPADGLSGACLMCDSVWFWPLEKKEIPLPAGNTWRFHVVGNQVLASEARSYLHGRGVAEMPTLPHSPPMMDDFATIVLVRDEDHREPHYCLVAPRERAQHQPDFLVTSFATWAKANAVEVALLHHLVRAQLDSCRGPTSPVQ